MDGMKLLRWFLGRMWDEENSGTLIAISVALAVGLVAGLHFGDWDRFPIWAASIVGCIVVIIVFPIAKILATATHARWDRWRDCRRSRDKMKRLLESLGGEEKAAIQECVFRGTSPTFSPVFDFGAVDQFRMDLGRGDMALGSGPEQRLGQDRQIRG